LLIDDDIVLLNLNAAILSRFIFEHLDYANEGEEALEAFEAKHLLLGRDKNNPPKPLPKKTEKNPDFDDDVRKNRKNKNRDLTSSSGNRGFGKK
jgi:hypothetical protein